MVWIIIGGVIALISGVVLLNRNAASNASKKKDELARRKAQIKSGTSPEDVARAPEPKTRKPGFGTRGGR